jgi:hypothetical protein
MGGRSITMAMSPEEMRTFDFASAPLGSLLGPLGALSSEARRSGLLSVEALSSGIDHPVLRSLLFVAINGMSPGDLVAFGLGAAIGKDAAEATRILFFTRFAVSLQSGDEAAEAELLRFLARNSPCRCLADALMITTMPLHWKRLQGREPELAELIGCARASDAQGLFIGGLLTLGVPNLDEAVELLARFRSAYETIHPFQWAFQDYLSTQEVERCGVEGLLGVLRFGFLAGPDMPESFRRLATLRDSGPAGPFSSFLLGMLHLYHEESVPYDPEKAFALFSESADQGSALGAEWRARFLESREPPAFPGGAVPRSVRGTEVFSGGEIANLISAFSSPEDGTTPAAPGWYDPGKVSATLLRQAPGWSAYCLRSHASRAASQNDAAKSWDYIMRGAVLQENWAVATVVGAWTGLPVGLFEAPEEGFLPRAQGLSGPSAEALRTRIRADRRSHPLLVLAANPHAYREGLAVLAERLAVGSGVPRSPELAARLKAELEAAERRDRAGSGELSQADIDLLLGQNAEEGK